MMYYIIEHPTRGVFMGFATSRTSNQLMPKFSPTKLRSEGAWLANRAHAERTLAAIRNAGVRKCYIMRATQLSKGGAYTTFTKDNMHQREI